MVVNYNGSGEKAQETVRDIQAAGGEAQTYGCNVADFNACRAMMEELTARYGHIDILVNNAGITRDGLMAKMSEEDFDDVIAINLKGCFNTMRHLYRQFLNSEAEKSLTFLPLQGSWAIRARQITARPRRASSGLPKVWRGSWEAGALR